MKDSSKKATGLFRPKSGTFDPTLESLFAGSLGPVKVPPRSRYQSTHIKESNRSPVEKDSEPVQSAESVSVDNTEEEEDDSIQSADSISEQEEDDGEDSMHSADSLFEEEAKDTAVATAQLQESAMKGNADQSHKKRKRKKEDEEVEDTYMRKLAREEIKEDQKRAAEQEKKRRKLENADKDDDQKSSDPADGTNGVSEQSDEETFSVPKHETLAADKDTEDIEKAARTVFLGNVSTQAIASKSAKKTLLNHLASFIPSLPQHDPAHKIESLRFRSTAFSSSVPKKAAFAKKEIMDATTKSTNAYAVYSTQVAAREAAKRLNGTVVLQRHLRVDEVAHPGKTDHRRCVFVGNLGFVDDESSLNADEDGQTKKKQKPPGDVEEGLWVHFGKAGMVESVRVVRDPKTRVGKGFAYVQFTDENGVEAALQFNDQKFPPLLPRKLRVVRAKGMKRNAKKPSASGNKSMGSNGVYNPKVSDQQKSVQGRAGKLLGRAGAAQFRQDRKPSSGSAQPHKTAFKSPESFVFEGHRASSKQGHSGLKLGGKKKGGKPKNRSSKRGAAWKASGGKKPGK